MPQVIQEFLAGTYPFEIPLEATNIIAEAIGSGGPGNPGFESMCGSGGAGGWFVRRDISMLAGQTVQVVVTSNGQGVTINAGGNIDVYAPGGLSPNGVNLPNTANGYLIVNAGGRGGYDQNGFAGTGGMPGNESIGGLNGNDGGGVAEGPGLDATLIGQGGDGGGLNSPGGLNGPGLARIIYDMPEPIEPEPEPEPEPEETEFFDFAAGEGDTLIVLNDDVSPEELSVLVDNLNGMNLVR